ncbi:RNA ligase/cyclic nucleotide phosphodiesterase [Powellomyces hirtus]|nr:RNA ligase/cyclic nucleotide phosphodiesterase [Powellomyces hirtus]
MCPNPRPAPKPETSFAGEAPPSNPLDVLLDSCENDPTRIQQAYETHRVQRNKRQAELMTDPGFKGVIPDEILKGVLADPPVTDPRHSLVIWARPPRHMRELISELQARLLRVAPTFWPLPVECTHITVLEITHSRTEAEIALMLDIVRSKVEEIVNHTLTHRAMLVNPIVSYDASALALSFLPAADSAYTYHHLRRDINQMTSDAGLELGSRYVVPSSHVTLGRFVTTTDFEGTDGRPDLEKMRRWIQAIEEVNLWLKETFWNKEDTKWTVGQEKGLVCQFGTVWYGGGESLAVGKGF